MKIVDVRRYLIEHKLDEPLSYSRGYCDIRSAHVVEVREDAVIVGYRGVFGGGHPHGRCGWRRYYAAAKARSAR